MDITDTFSSPSNVPFDGSLDDVGSPKKVDGHHVAYTPPGTAKPTRHMRVYILSHLSQTVCLVRDDTPQGWS